MVFLFVFNRQLQSIFNHFNVLLLFISVVGYDEMSISAAREHTRRMTSPFDSLIPIFDRSSVDSFVIS